MAAARIVEANPRKFKLEQSELEARRQFVVDTKKKVEEMKEHMASPSTRSREEKRSRQVMYLYASCRNSAILLFIYNFVRLKISWPVSNFGVLGNKFKF